MSLNVHEIQLGEQAVTLRLTSKALLSYSMKHGVEGNSPAVAVLNAISDYAAREDLFTKALGYPDNKNSIKDGNTLQDLLADHGWDRDDVNKLILDLAAEAGLLKDDEVVDLLHSAKVSGAKVVNTLGRLLRGDRMDAPEKQKAVEDSQEENPT